MSTTQARLILEGLQLDLEAAAAFQQRAGGQQCTPPVLTMMPPGVRIHVSRAIRHALEALTSSPWRPIEECGELEEKIDIMYLVWAQNEEFSGPCIANRRNGRWELTDKPEFFEVSDITHVHQAGPIRGPGER